MGAILRRKCATCAAGGAPCAHCREEDARLRRTPSPGPQGSDGAHAPPIARAVLSDGGESLDVPVRRQMEAQLGAKLGDVRVHRDSRAAVAARSVGALAYTVGRHVVFGTGQFAPESPRGRALLAHELTHVLQDGGAPVTGPIRIGQPGDALELEAERAADGARVGPRTRGARPALRRTLDPQMSTYLERMRGVLPLQGPDLPRDTAQKQATQILHALRGLDLTDPDNLTVIAEAVSRQFDSDTLIAFLGQVESMLPAAAEPSEERDAFANFPGKVRRRGAYGTYFGPTPSLAAPLAPLLHALESAKDFVEGVYDGLTEMDAATAETFLRKLVKSSLTGPIFPVVFGAGAAKGIFDDAVELVKTVQTLVEDWREVLDGAVEILSLMFTPKGPALAKRLGREVGKEFAAKIGGMLKLSVTSFIYELGRLVGPTIVYAVLAFLGLPQLGFARVAQASASFMRQSPRLAALAKKVAKRADARRDRIAALRQQHAPDATADAKRRVDPREQRRTGADVEAEPKGQVREPAASTASSKQRTGEGGKPAGGAPSRKEREELAEIGAITPETRDLLRQRPALRSALAEHDDARRVLKSCASSCFPDVPPALVKELDDLLAEMREWEIPYDVRALRRYFKRHRDNVPDAIARIRERVERRKAEASGAPAMSRPGEERLPSRAPDETQREIDNRSASTRISHDTAVAEGRKRALKDGLREGSPPWKNPFESPKPYGEGFDDILDDAHGDPVVIEYKGDSSRLGPGQLSTGWVKRKIAQLRAVNDPMAARLCAALQAGKLTARVYRTLNVDGRVQPPKRAELRKRYPKVKQC